MTLFSGFLLGADYMLPPLALLFQAYIRRLYIVYFLCLRIYYALLGASY